MDTVTGGDWDSVCESWLLARKGMAMTSQEAITEAARRSQEAIASAAQAWADGVQKLVLVPEVAVHAHGPDVELLREPAHAERLEAILLDHRERGVDDPLPRQPAGPRFCSARHLCTV